MRNFYPQWSKSTYPHFLDSAVRNSWDSTGMCITGFGYTQIDSWKNPQNQRKNRSAGGFIHIISKGYTHFINKLWINPVNLVDNHKKLVGNKKKGYKQRIKKENILTEAWFMHIMKMMFSRLYLKNEKYCQLW